MKEPTESQDDRAYRKYLGENMRRRKWEPDPDEEYHEMLLRARHNADAAKLFLNELKKGEEK